MVKLTVLLFVCLNEVNNNAPCRSRPDGERWTITEGELVIEYPDGSVATSFRHTFVSTDSTGASRTREAPARAAPPCGRSHWKPSRLRCTVSCLFHGVHFSVVRRRRYRLRFTSRWKLRALLMEKDEEFLRRRKTSAKAYANGKAKYQ